MRRVALLALVLLLPVGAMADEPLRCGSWVVSLPTSVADLVKKCGEPAAKEVTTDDIRTSGRTGVASRVTGTTTTERWTYRTGSQSIPMVVTVIDGKVTKIERAR
jgi:hypothetical protein